MGNRRLIIAAIMLGVCVMAFGLSYMLLQDTKMATMGYVGVLGLTIFFVEPFIGLVNYLIFLYARPHEYIAGMVGTPVMLMIAAATAGLMIVHMLVSKRHRYFAKAPQNYFVIWFLAAITASHLSYLFLEGAIAATTDFITIVIMYFLIANLVVSENKLRVTFYLLVVLTVTIAVSGIVQFYTGFGLGGAEAYKDRIQGIGIFSDPNDLALALVIVLPFLFFKLTEDKGTVYGKAFNLICLVVLIYALILTQSRGGLLALGVLAMLLFSRRVGPVLGYSLGGLGMASLFLASSRMSTISTEEGSAYGRIQAWGIGMDLFESSPLFGVGAGNFTEYHFRTAHNSFVLCAAELGVFGLFPWLMMVYLVIRNMSFVSNHAGEARMTDTVLYADSLRYGMIAFVAAAFWLSRTYSELFFILVALSTALTHMYVKSSGARYKLIERRDFIWGLGLVVATWVVVKVFLFFAW